MAPPVDPSVSVVGDPSLGSLDVMPGDIVTVAIPFAAGKGNVVAGGISFGPGQPIQVVPMPDAMGLSQGQMQLQFLVPPSVCDNLSMICHQVECYEFAVTDIGEVSAADINGLALACNDCEEPSCQMFLDMCQPMLCDSTIKAGGDAPESHVIDLAKPAGTFDFYYDTATVADRIVVRYEGGVLFDTGCVGAYDTVSIDYAGTSTSIEIDITPNCLDPSQSGTVWEFSVSCPL
jgi:hypothetical protein